MACDLLAVDTIWLRRLYVLFFVQYGSRRVFLAGITTNPISAWVTQRACNVTANPRDAGIDVEFLLRDRDAKSGPSFRRGIARRGCKDLTKPSPGAQRERHLRRVLGRYVCHFNEHRPHRDLVMRSPVPSPTEIPAMRKSIRRHEVLGGLINEYHPA
ncbi:MAG: hypothetical protein ACP5P1_15440 [Acidimicrobiales bacterium]